jgi:hypothetical protein
VGLLPGEHGVDARGAFVAGGVGHRSTPGDGVLWSVGVGDAVGRGGIDAARLDADGDFVPRGMSDGGDVDGRAVYFEGAGQDAGQESVKDAFR